ncbi:LysR family transcriptional regulator [Nitratireductor mangrovi]|uniref:LysR family transcriptional regulator n=1 Tax=Nitratireductor mangrovi TaxID=2599600 RepID=A0A5B8L0I7_9HYPH|nr:LysR family transcriptional regulator [Nitratireductor mangrovi]
MNFSGIDLNLLRIFDAMMQERSTTRVAERVGLSQPAVSSALGRLRHIAGDELFIREGNRMVPTTKAELMHAPVRAAMARVEDAFDVAMPFDPPRAERTFRILGSDYFSTLIMPSLAAAVHVQAPRVVLQMLDMPSSEVVPALSDGRVDLAFSPSTIEPPDYIRKQTLFHSYIVAAAAKGNERLRDAGIAAGERLPAELYCALPHVVMSMDGSRRGTIDTPLEDQGLSRSVMLTLPHFHAVASAVASSDMVGNLPVHYARLVAPQMNLELYLPPFDPPIIDVNLYWHRRHDSDSANSWLRTMIRRISSFADEADPQDPVLCTALHERRSTTAVAEKAPLGTGK